MILMAGFALGARAQCVFDPTVTPNNLILCPFESDTLWTQTYDAYQWYMNGSPINGATQQFYVVSSMDAGSNFSVEATLGGCTEMSPDVLVDGWVFLLPFAMTDGDFFIEGPGVTRMCENDTVLLILMPPYETNIQWADGGVPIQGATNDTLFVTSSGNFTVWGSPLICPNYTETLGVTIPVSEVILPVPVISLMGGDLVCSQPGYAYQWYFNSTILPSDTNISITPLAVGSYTVEITDSNGCNKMSAPYLYNVNSIDDPETHSLKIYPNPASGTVYVQYAGNVLYHITDVTGRKMMSGMLQQNAIDIEALPSGVYMLSLEKVDGSLISQRFIKL